MYTIIDGKTISRQIEEEIKTKVAEIVAAGGREPHLSAILVGHDGGSETYMANKVKACQRCGIRSSLHRYDTDITEEQLLQAIRELNDDPDVDGFIVQLPLPRHIDEQKVIEAIDPAKDVDGFHPVNLGQLVIGLDAMRPATPAGIMELLERYAIPTRGRRCVVLGRSNIVGKPVALLMMQKANPGDATVTVCHSHTPDMAAICREADIIISAMGRPGTVTADMVKPGAVVIDVGTTLTDDPTAPGGKRLRGDVDFDSVAPLCSAITPVPGGVGPMTISMLMLNTLRARLKRN